MNNLIPRNTNNLMAPLSQNLITKPFALLDMVDDIFKNHYSLKIIESLPLEVTQNDTSYKVTVEIPGFSKEDIKVSLDKGTLNVIVESKKDNEQKEGEQVIFSERYYSKKSRSIYLGENIDAENIKAHYDNGILSLEIPKSQKEDTVKHIMIE